MAFRIAVPLIQKSKEEAQEQRTTWLTGAYNFLLSRTQEKYRLKVNEFRRKKVESQLNLTLSEINDLMLKELYQFACVQYMHRCRRDYGAKSGFGNTASEAIFAKTLATIIKNNPKLKHIEVYPSAEYSKDFPPGLKMVVGNYVPDFIVFGLKNKRSTGVAIEIDGDSHVDKWEKDELRSKHLEEQKIFTWEIQNGQVSDFKFITAALFSLYRLRTGSLNEQILRAKRGIWVRTISCQLSFSEIEDFVSRRFAVQLNLREEAQAILAEPTCPRKLRAELLNHGFIQKP